MDTHLAFSLERTQIRNRILIPKYYDPDIELAARRAGERFDLPRLGDLLLSGPSGSQLGDWIPRELYGTGTIPYVRTSDLSRWRIRADYKKGVSEQVYLAYRNKQDVRADDILLVAHGTYLVGNVALVTEEDSRLVLQDHVFRLRINPETGVNPCYLLAALSTSFVRRQIRARQFSADIIDKLGDRHLEVRVPLLRDATQRPIIARRVRAILAAQSSALLEFQTASGSNLRMTRERAEARYAFSLRREYVKSRILIPKYYDPELDEQLRDQEASDNLPWIRLDDLIASGALTLTSGIEVGKMAYGTGDIPFIRTSDMVDGQIRRDVRQGVSERLYRAVASRASVAAGDVLMVRDGTYLVGSSAIVTADDVPAIICGGLLRFRSLRPRQLSPYWLLGVLNFPIVRKQLRARQFTRDVIDTLGDRVREVRVPNPSSERARTLAEQMAEMVDRQKRAKAQMSVVIQDVEPEPPALLNGRPAWSMR